MLADRLREKRRLDLVLTHHPEGRALAKLGDVMGMQADILHSVGVPIATAEALLNTRIGEVSRRLLPVNHTRAVDAARLLGLPFMCVHTPGDNQVVAYLQKIFDAKQAGDGRRGDRAAAGDPGVPPLGGTSACPRRSSAAPKKTARQGARRHDRRDGGLEGGLREALAHRRRHRGLHAPVRGAHQGSGEAPHQRGDRRAHRERQHRDQPLCSTRSRSTGRWRSSRPRGSSGSSGARRLA